MSSGEELSARNTTYQAVQRGEQQKYSTSARRRGHREARFAPQTSPESFPESCVGAETSRKPQLDRQEKSVRNAKRERKSAMRIRNGRRSETILGISHRYDENVAQARSACRM